MRTPCRFIATLIAAAAAIATLPAAAQDADSQEVMHYALTDAGLAKFTQASENLAALPRGGPGNCGGEDDTDADSRSIAEMAARLDAFPGAKAAVQSAGMSTHEYIVFSMSLLQNGLAAWGMSQPGAKLPPGVNKANVDFVNTHGPQLDQLKALNGKSGDCGDEAEEEEPEG